MLKNYTVRIKNVKVEKVSQILNYLNNSEHKNHTKKNTEIYELSNRDAFEKQNASKLILNEENYYRNGKGGRKLKISNKSLTFNFPKNYETNIEDCKKINKLLTNEIIKLYKSYNVEIDIEEIYNVLHFQDNSHIHSILPYLDKSGNTIREVKSKRFTIELKFLFTKCVDNVLGTSYKDYKPLSEPQKENNRVRAYLLELKAYYEHYLQFEDSKYYKNQIISIDRVLKENPEEINDAITKLENNSIKAHKMRESAKVRTTTLPKF